MSFAKSFLHIAGTVLLSLFLISPAQAADVIYTGTFSDKAVSGYDTVAYFTDGKPVKGSDKFSTKYKGAVWQFASQAHLDAFKAAPEKYAPQYGGYCAYAIAAKNSLVSSDPEAWKIVDGKLYLNYDKDIQAEWVMDIPGYIKKGDANWPGLNK
ncbi:MAG: YHS domain-containing protein [Rickettsiales bacterium]|nr:YHS domain-containing protein [Rickettsiales bacterium]